MTFRDREFDRGRGNSMEWECPGNGYRGQFTSPNRFGGWSDESQDMYDMQGFRGQERYGDQFGGEFGQGGYGQRVGRQATDWPSETYSEQPFSQGGWEQRSMGGRGYRGESQFGGWHGDSNRSMRPYGGPSYGPRGFDRASGWQPNAEQGWDLQGPARGGSWDQRQTWEQGPSGRGHWGQGYSDPGMMGLGQGPRAQQRFSSRGYGSQGQPAGTYFYEEVWLMPGPHSGRGPRGYQRNDQRIEEDICERLTQHGQIDAEDIQVKVKNGEVTLTGMVEDRQTKRMAEDALDSISGIKDVHNQLRVQPGQVRSDEDELIGQTRMGESQGSSATSRGQSRNQSRRTETAGVGASSS